MEMAKRSTEEVLARFQTLLADAPAKRPAAEAARAAYLDAACVLHLFRPGDLRPAGRGIAPGEAALHLGDSIVAALGHQEEGLRTLRLEDRQMGLRRLGSRAAMAEALSFNPGRPRTDVQRLVDRWIEQGRLDLEALGLPELRATRVLAEWGLTDFEGFPSRTEIETAWRRRSSVADFEQVAANFVGRERELAVLSEFAGLQPPSLVSRARAFLLGQRRAPLVLHGLGGVGKTALVGRFILDYFSDPSRARFPFLYIPFDDRAIDPSEPGTILANACGQIRQQLSSDSTVDSSVLRSLELSESLIASYFRAKDQLAGRGSKQSSLSARSSSLRAIEERMNGAFADLLAAASGHFGQMCGEERSPVLAILDTFEDVEIRPDRHLRSFWRLIDLLCRRLPELRLLIVSRAAPTSAALAHRRPQALQLGDLTGADAAALLERLGIDDPALAEAVASQVGTNPLTLRLAARVLLDVGADGLDGLKTRRFGLFSVGEEVIRGQLYRRILGHIHDPRVRLIAHPGMVLRRVTPAIIREVLAPACGLGELGAPQADDLFAALAREHTLVSKGIGNALVYRSEVRQPMLRLLTSDQPEKAAELHRKAAEFYSGLKDETSRAEEIYHLLMLPDPPHHYLDERWKPSLERLLAPSFEELPSQGLIWLASRTRIKLPPELLSQARQEDAEQFIGREATAALRHGAHEEALSLLQQIQPTPASPLHVLRARTLAVMGRLDEAGAALDWALASFPPFGPPARLAELQWLAAQIDSERGDDTAASAMLRRLIPLVRKLGARLALIQTLTRAIQIEGPRGTDLKRELHDTLLMLDGADRDREPAMLRLALVALGPELTLPWVRIVPDVGYETVQALGSLPGRDLQALANRIAEAFRGTPYGGVMTAMIPLDPAQLPSALYSMLTKMIEGEPSRPAAVRGLWELFRAEGGSLSGGGLAGLDRDRAQWELEEAAVLA